MCERFDPRVHIGEQYGIYIIQDVLPEDQKDKDGHWIYKATCVECGFERFATYGVIKRNPATRCTHVHEYKLNICLYCGNEIPMDDLKPSDYNRKKFCNNSCASSYNNKHSKKEKYNECINCGRKISVRNTYCSPKCQHEYKQKQWEKQWLSGKVDGNKNSEWTQVSKRVRTYLFKKYDNKCAICGWGEINPYTKTIPLEVEHIDGDPYNSSPDNVTLLCPNCHSLTATYRGANRGNGRKKTWIPTAKLL